MIRYGAGALAALLIAGAAQAQSPADVVNHHMASVAKSDIDAMMSDYADDAVVLEAGQAIQGKAAIRALFERIFPKPAPGAPPRATPQPTKVWQDGDVGFTTWTMGATKGGDDFLVRGGKIQVQAVFIPAPTAPPGR